MTLFIPITLYWLENLACLTFSSWRAFINRFFSLYSSKCRSNLYYLKILSSNSCWCLSRAFNNFSAFSFAISVSLWALYSSNTSLLILFSKALTFIPESFCKYLASSISIPSLRPFLPPWWTKLWDLDESYFPAPLMLIKPPLIFAGCSPGFILSWIIVFETYGNIDPWLLFGVESNVFYPEKLSWELIFIFIFM